MFFGKEKFFWFITFGWVLMLVGIFVSYFTTPESSCALLARFHNENSVWGTFFIGAALVSFMFGTKELYSSYYNETKISTKSSLLLFISITAAVLIMPFNAHDVSFYYSAGKAAYNGINPFISDWTMSNQFICGAGERTINGIMYGPLVVFLFKIFYALSGGKILIFTLWWKLLMLLSFVVSGILCWNIIKKLVKVDKRHFYILWLAQPLMLWEWVGSGHFDVLWIAYVLLAFFFAQKGKWWLVLSCLAIGTWIKFMPILMAPWFLLWWWQETNRYNWKKNVISVSVGFSVSMLITLFSWKSFWEGFKTIQPIIAQTKWAVTSIFAALYYSLKDLFVILFGNETAHWWLTRFVHGMLLLIVIFFLWPLIKKTWLGILRRYNWKEVDYMLAIFISMLVYLSLWQKSFWPWYISWLLPFGIFLVSATTNNLLRKIVSWLSVFPILFYIIWILNKYTRETDPSSELWFYYTIILIVWLYPLFLLTKWRRQNYGISSEDTSI